MRARRRRGSSLVLRGDDGEPVARLGAAARRHRRPRQVHRPADRRSCTRSTADPREERNQAPASRARAEVLLNTLRGFNVAPPALPGEETSAVRDRLRALGYVGGSPAAPRDRYGEDDDPKRLIEIDALLHRAGDLYQQGQPQRSREALPGGHRASGPTPPTPIAISRSSTGRTVARPRRSSTLETALEERRQPPRRPREARDLSGGDRQRRARDRAARRPGRRRHRGAERARNRLRAGRPRRGRDHEPSSTRSRSIRPTAWRGRTSAPCSCAPATVAAAETSLRRALADRRHARRRLHDARRRPVADRAQAQTPIDDWTARRGARTRREFDALYNLTVTLMRARAARRGKDLRRAVRRDRAAGVLSGRRSRRYGPGPIARQRIRSDHARCTGAPRDRDRTRTKHRDRIGRRTKYRRALLCSSRSSQPSRCFASKP